MASSGQLTIRPLNAMLEHSTNLITSMDPYVLISLGSQQWKSQVNKNGGKTPSWNDEALFQIQPGVDIIRISIFDDKAIGADKLIAEGVIPMEKLLSFSSPFEEKIPLTFKAKPCGYISLRVFNSNTSEKLGQQNLTNNAFQPTYLQDPLYQQNPAFTQNPTLPQNVEPSQMVAQNQGDVPIQDLQYQQAPVLIPEQIPASTLSTGTVTTAPIIAQPVATGAIIPEEQLISQNHHDPHGTNHSVNEHHGLASHDWKHKKLPSPRAQGYVYTDVPPNTANHPLTGNQALAGERIVQEEVIATTSRPIVQEQIITTSQPIVETVVTQPAVITTTSSTVVQPGQTDYFPNFTHNNSSLHSQHSHEHAVQTSSTQKKGGFFSNLFHRNKSGQQSVVTSQQQQTLTSQVPLTSQQAMLAQAQPHTHTGVGTCTTCQQAIPSDYYQRVAMAQSRPSNAELINDHPKHYNF